MEIIKNVNLQIKVYKYKTKDEMETHIKEMISKGFILKREGEYNLSKESTVSAYCDNRNWYWVAEFYKDSITQQEQINHETTLYWY